MHMCVWVCVCFYLPMCARQDIIGAEIHVPSLSAPTYLFGLCVYVYQECDPGMCMYTSSPRSLRSLLVHVTHQSAVRSRQWGSGGRAEECSLCAILGHTGCSGGVTTAAHGCVFASFTCVDYGCRQVCVFLCVCACVCTSALLMHTSLDCPLQDNDLLPAIANEWNHFGRASQSIVQGICL